VGWRSLAPLFAQASRTAPPRELRDAMSLREEQALASPRSLGTQPLGRTAPHREFRDAMSFREEQGNASPRSWGTRVRAGGGLEPTGAGTASFVFMSCGT